jgi:hypothetical protein
MNAFATIPPGAFPWRLFSSDGRGAPVTSAELAALPIWVQRVEDALPCMSGGSPDGEALTRVVKGSLPGEAASVTFSASTLFGLPTNVGLRALAVVLEHAAEAGTEAVEISLRDLAWEVLGGDHGADDQDDLVAELVAVAAVEVEVAEGSGKPARAARLLGEFAFGDDPDELGFVTVGSLFLPAD